MYIYSLKPIWILLRYVTFHIQVKIALYVMSPTLEYVLMQLKCRNETEMQLKWNFMLTELVFRLVWNLKPVWVHFASHVNVLLESFNIPLMRLWFYAAFIQIDFGSSVQSSHWNYTIKYSFRHSDVPLLYGSFEYVSIK